MIEWWETLQGGMGSAHGVNGDRPEKTVVDRLHEVVEEITGKPIPREPERRIGFLPWSER